MQSLVVLIISVLGSVHVSDQTFLIFFRKKMQLTVDTFCVVSVAVIRFVYISTRITFYMGHMSFSTCFSMVAGSIHNPSQLSVHGLWIDISIELGRTCMDLLLELK